MAHLRLTVTPLRLTKSPLRLAVARGGSQRHPKGSIWGCGAHCGAVEADHGAMKAHQVTIGSHGAVEVQHCASGGSPMASKRLIMARGG
jgi:hypothetical protein